MPEMAELVSSPAVECLNCGKLFGPTQIFHLKEDPRRAYIRCPHCGARNEVRAEQRFMIRLVGIIPEPPAARIGAQAMMRPENPLP
jgi:DNA-directed RNA polymerase subunit RPC12/RpoP